METCDVCIHIYYHFVYIILYDKMFSAVSGAKEPNATRKINGEKDTMLQRTRQWLILDVSPTY